MTRRREFSVAILGGGPAGLIAALAVAERARAALILNRLPTSSSPMRIDSLPARTLALLVELGIRPEDLGVTSLQSQSWRSWETAEPYRIAGVQTAHVERPRLERSLFAALCARGQVSIIVDSKRPSMNGRYFGQGWRANTLIDATGRAMLSATTRVRPNRPWASSFYWSKRNGASPEFRIAALRCGYAYRLGSADHIGIGIAGRGGWLRRDPQAIETAIREDGAGWLLDGMPAISELQRGAAGTCSVQWAQDCLAIPVGDAALARDSLSSQGLAASASDSLYAVAAAGDKSALHSRHSANLRAHLHQLGDVLDRCRFRGAPVWRDYESFVAKSAFHQPVSAVPLLRGGKLITGQ
jgi:FAD binding domain